MSQPGLCWVQTYFDVDTKLAMKLCVYVDIKVVDVGLREEWC